MYFQSQKIKRVIFGLNKPRRCRLLLSENVFDNSGFYASRILVEFDGQLDYLLKYETILAITVDGANRKWIGTQSSGVFLVSETGTEQLLHFTEENSSLISNTVNTIAINDKTGEVFSEQIKESFHTEEVQQKEVHSTIRYMHIPILFVPIFQVIFILPD